MTSNHEVREKMRAPNNIWHLPAANPVKCSQAQPFPSHSETTFQYTFLFWLFLDANSKEIENPRQRMKENS